LSRKKTQKKSFTTQGEKRGFGARGRLERPENTDKVCSGLRKGGQGRAGAGGGAWVGDEGQGFGVMKSSSKNSMKYFWVI
jgi:hypothetical protein